MRGGHLWPGKCLRLKLLKAAGYHRCFITPGLLSHSSTNMSLETAEVSYF